MIKKWPRRSRGRRAKERKWGLFVVGVGFSDPAAAGGDQIAIARILGGVIVDGLIDAVDPGPVECGNEFGVGQKLDREQPEVETTLVGLRGMLVNCGALIAGITPRSADAEVVLVAAVPFGHDAEMGGPAGADDAVGELVAGIGYSTEEHEALGLSF